MLKKTFSRKIKKNSALECCEFSPKSTGGAKKKRKKQNNKIIFNMLVEKLWCFFSLSFSKILGVWKNRMWQKFRWV